MLGPAVIAALIAAAAFPGLAQAQNSSAQQPAQQEDSLAEAARKARANKPKTETKHEHVYTTDEISTSSGSRGGSAASGQDGGGSAANAANKALGMAGGATGGSAVRPTGGGAAGNGKDEAYWRQRAQSLREQMAQVDAEIDKLQDEIKKGGSAGFNVQSGLKTDTVYFDDRDSKMKRLQQKKADIQKQIDALEDEARKEDVPSSWIH